MSFSRDSVRTVAVRIAILFLGLASGIIHARWLGPEGVGMLALFYLIHNFAFRFGNLGFGSGFSFFVAKKMASADDATRLGWLIGGLMSAVSSLVLLLVWQLSFSPWRDLPALVVYLGIPTIPLFFFKNYFQHILSGRLNIKAVNFSEILSTLAYLPLVAVLVIYLKMGLTGALISYITTETLILFYLLLCLKKSGEPVPRAGGAGGLLKLTRDIWNYGRWSYLIIFLNFYQEQFPLMVLSYFSSARAVGFFSTGRNIMMRMQLIPQSFAQVLFPFTAASEENDATRRTNVLCRSFLVFTGLVVALLGVLAKPVVVILYGEAFLPAVSVVYSLLPAILLYPLIQFLPVHVAAFGKPKLVFMRNLFATPACFLFCLLLVPLYGAVGAGLSLTAMFLLLAVLNLFIYAKATGSRFSEVLILKKQDLLYYKKLYEKRRGRGKN